MTGRIRVDVEVDPIEDRGRNIRSQFVAAVEPVHVDVGVPVPPELGQRPVERVEGHVVADPDGHLAVGLAEGEVGVGNGWHVNLLLVRRSSVDRRSLPTTGVIDNQACLSA